jgi:hypothetical protein
MSVWRLTACSAMLASCELSYAVYVLDTQADLKRQCSCSLAHSRKTVWLLVACFVELDVFVACCMVYRDAFRKYTPFFRFRCLGQGVKLRAGLLKYELCASLSVLVC